MCFSTGPVVYMGCTASRKFKSLKGLKEKNLALSRNLAAHASAGMTVNPNDVHTRVYRSTHFRTYCIRVANANAHRGQAIASTNEADRESNTRECGKASLTRQLDEPHLNQHLGPSLGERLVPPHLLIGEKKPEIWVLHRKSQ